jgi:hypothetical protein
LILDPSDPDGPYRGGLDDPTDFAYLFTGLKLAGVLALCFKMGVFRDPQSLLQLIYYLLYVTGVTYTILMAFGEAFDVIDYDRDGC